jgi:hypothetical protein
VSDDSDPDRVALSFVDLLYAVPVAALATRVSETHLKGVSLSGWTDIGLALVALTLGWIGHHTNRLRRQKMAPEPSIPTAPFTELRFVQFFFEVFIIGVYFALSTRLRLPGSPGVAMPELHWKASWLLALFVLYLCWDVLDITIAKKRGKHEWETRACWGAKVTGLFIVVFGVGRLLTPADAHSAAPFDIICIFALYGYRVAQQCVIRRNCANATADSIHVVAQAVDGPELFLDSQQAKQLVELRNRAPSTSYAVYSVALKDRAAGRTLLEDERRKQPL